VNKLILTALYELYERLAADSHSGIARLGYTETPVVAAFELSLDGQLIGAVPLGAQKGKRVIGARLMVPERVKKAAGDYSNFMCENMEYLIGVRPGAAAADERSTRRKVVCKNLHLQILGEVDDEGAKAVLRFLSRDPEDLLQNEHLRAVREVVDGGGNIVFRLSGDNLYIHDRPAVRRAWENYVSRRSEASPQGQCLITGTRGPIARLHMSTKGVLGGQPTGTSLVSFDMKCSESYGKRQGGNAPVSERAAFSYGTALNWLTSRDRHHVLAGDTTIVFWAERAGPEEDLTLALLREALGGYREESGDIAGSSASQAAGVHDEAKAQMMKSILEMVFRGKMPALGATDLDPEVRFYILGLSPNAARLSVRFWHINTFGGVMENLRRHYDDLTIIHHERARPVSVPRILMELTPPASRKREAIPKVLIGSLMRSILEGTPYPQALFALMISRIRIDSNDPDQPRVERKVDYPRAAYIKAHLLRKARVSGDKKLEEGLTEVLNTENRNPGYMLGRLFALLEKAQQDANPGIKATIKDRDYASASATPGAVVPVLIRLAQHHLSKSDYGHYVDKLIERVISHVGSFPNHLTLNQQGLFALGYYQQRAALYTKSDEEKKGGEEQ
jgi:CRISPR-associated protein Csd1